MRSASRRSRRDSMAAGGKSCIRAAANSIASGRPSRCLQISATACAFPAFSLNPGSFKRARSTKSCTASPYSCGSGPDASSALRNGTDQIASPLTANGARLVARIRSSGQALRSSCATLPHAAVKCSQLSRTSSSRIGRSQSTTVSSTGWSTCSRTPTAAAMACGTSDGSAIGASSVNATEITRRSASRCATSTAKRVYRSRRGQTASIDAHRSGGAE